MPQSKDSLLPLSPSQTMGGATEQKAIIQSLIGKRHTMLLVEVDKVYETDELAPVGFVDIKPMVSMIDGANNIYPRGVIKKVPFFRLQGGTNAVIIDPKKGDIGIAGVCERDISMVKRTRAPAAPNTRRQFSLNDAVYFGGTLNGTPQQYILFTETEVKIKASQKIILDAPEVEATGMITASGIIKSLADVVANAISLLTHRHGGVQSGGSDTGTPK